MSNFYYGAHAPLHQQPSHSQHRAPGAVAGGSRSRRATRAAQAWQNQQQQQLRALRLQQKEAEDLRLEKAQHAFEAARGFDFEDDEMYCPFNLLTEDDVRSSPLPTVRR
jgi:hypothetical protein